MLINFKEQVAKDIDILLFNENEFAEKHTVRIGKTAKEILLIVNSTTEQDFELLGKHNSRQFDGMFASQKVVYVRVSDLDEEPKQGDIFALDRKQYKIAELNEKFGLYEIHLDTLNQRK